MTSLAHPRGAALIITLLAVSLLSALGMGLALASSAGRLAGGNHHESLLLLNAAEASLALASRELAASPDWTPVLNGSLRAAASDAPSPGVRRLADGTVIDMARLTNEVTCGRTSLCSDATVRAVTLERPWGARNPVWQPYLYTALEAVLAVRETSGVYVVVWIGDDPAEQDNDPRVDGGDADGKGRFVVRARADAFGLGGARRSLEAGLRRVCADVADISTCRPGIRVQSWRMLSGTLP